MNNKSWEEIMRSVEQRGNLTVESGMARRALWFALVNIAVLLPLLFVVIRFGGGSGRNIDSTSLMQIFAGILALGFIIPLLMLACSRQLAIQAHKMTKLTNEEGASEKEKKLCTLIKNLALRAGLENPPEVWVYDSPDMNAFATGPSKKKALVAFSSALLKSMDEEAVAAVAAHEIAHIANGDMLTMSIVQGFLNCAMAIILIPVYAVGLVLLFVNRNDKGGYSFLFEFLIVVAKVLITAIVFFIVNLVVKAFSRKREYAADALAASIIDKGSMIHALSILGGETAIVPTAQASYNTMKINNVSKWGSIFSTHPSIVERIKRLEGLAP